MFRATTLGLGITFSFLITSLSFAQPVIPEIKTNAVYRTTNGCEFSEFRPSIKISNGKTFVTLGGWKSVLWKAQRTETSSGSCVIRSEQTISEDNTTLTAKDEEICPNGVPSVDSLRRTFFFSKERIDVKEERKAPGAAEWSTLWECSYTSRG